MLTRRSYLKASAATVGAACAARFLPSVWAQTEGANSDIRVAVIGLGNKGSQHVNVFSSLAGARLVGICDLDAKRVSATMEKLAPRKLAPFTATDPRRVLERSDVDAVVIATPDHWHALLTVWACQAGKDVYVEKPVCHNLWEGRQMIAAASATKRIVQSGTQYRSDEGLREAAEWLRAGNIGRPKRGRVVWYELREDIGLVAPYRPQEVDYDLYCGPAPLEPLTRKKLHYDWHWVWSTGTGDLGNSGIHAFDVCRWFAGMSGLPRRVMSLGGRYVWKDAGQTPNTQLTLVDYPEVPMLIENRNLPQQTGMKAMDVYREIREGFALTFEGGSFVGLRGGGSVFDSNGKRVRQFAGDGGGKHTANWVAAICSRRSADLHAPLEEGYTSSAICLLGNMSVRLGRPADSKAGAAAVGKFAEAEETLLQLRRHLAANGVKSDGAVFSLGPWLETDARGGVHAAGGSAETLQAARALVRPQQRAPYEVPGRV